MTDTKELRRLLAERDASDPKTLLWHVQSNTFKDALGNAAPELLNDLDRAKELLSRAETELAYVQACTEACGSTMCASSEGQECIKAIAAFLAQKETT